MWWTICRPNSAAVRSVPRVFLAPCVWPHGQLDVLVQGRALMSASAVGGGAAVAGGGGGGACTAPGAGHV
jgi:hypothetical protein